MLYRLYVRMHYSAHPSGGCHWLVLGTLSSTVSTSLELSDDTNVSVIAWMARRAIVIDDVRADT